MTEFACCKIEPQRHQTYKMETQKVEDRAYLQNRLDDILKPMLTKMFVANPTDPVS